MQSPHETADTALRREQALRRELASRRETATRRGLRALACVLLPLLALLADGGSGVFALASSSAARWSDPADCCQDVCTCRAASASWCCTGGTSELLVVAPCGCGHHEGGSMWVAQRLPWDLPMPWIAHAARIPTASAELRASIAPQSRRPAPGAPVPRG